jgi:hypothetical protein
MRQKIQSAVLEVKKKEEPTLAEFTSDRARSVSLHYHPADRSMGTFILQALPKAGLQLAQQEAADVHIVIVSNRTSIQDLTQLSEALPRHVIYALITPILTQSPELKPFLEKQWVDLRQANPETVRALVTHIANPTAENQFAMHITPVGFSEHRIPAIVQYSYFIVQLVTGFLTATGVWSLYHGEGGLFLTLFGIALFYYADLLLMRRAGLPSFLHTLSGRFLLWFASPGLTSPDPIGLGSDAKQRRYRWISFMAMVVVFLLQFAYDASRK